MGTLANSEDPDEMLHNAAFHQGLHLLLRQDQSLEEEIHVQYFFRIVTCDPSLYIMDHLDIAVSNFMENSIGFKRVKGQYFRDLVKSLYQKHNFLISQPKHMLWVLKRTSQWDGSFEHPKHMLKLMGKKILTILRSQKLFI